jgi:hypothetical protein
MKIESTQREKSPGGEKAQESYTPGFSLNNWAEKWTLAWSKTLKAFQTS